jgi:hypothetical protein
MKKFAFLMSVAMILGVVALVAPTEVQAQGTRPCCEGGFKPNKPCTDDSQCQDICEGGHRDGKPCSTSPCNPACVGGSNDGGNCATGGDADCTAACVGGSRDGQNCDPSSPNCPGGSCSNVGTCSESTCTAVCLKPGGPKSPDEPASQWQQFQDFLADIETEDQAQN